MNFLESTCSGMSSFAAAITVPLIIAYVYYHYYGTVHCGCAANIESERNTSITLITSSVCVLRHCVLRMHSPSQAIEEFKQLRNYYIQNKKLNKTEKKHYYREMRSTNGRKLIKQFHEILDQFKSAFSLIEKDKTPTIHLVLDVLDRIFNDFTATDETGQAHTFPSVIKANGADLMETKALRKEIRDTIDPKIMDHLEDIHYEAALLCPAFKNVEFFRQYKPHKYCKRAQAIASLKVKLQIYGRELIGDQNDNNNNNNSNNNSNNAQQPPRKKRKLSLSAMRFSSQRQEQNPRRANRLGALNELTEYLKETVVDPNDEFRNNPLKYWFGDHAQKAYPTLAKIAVSILTIPAASAFVERLFSLSGWLASGRRSHMKPHTLRCLCCLKKRKRYRENNN
eukprot:1021029_1